MGCMQKSYKKHWKNLRHKLITKAKNLKRFVVSLIATRGTRDLHPGV